MSPELLDETELAGALRVSVSTVQSWRYQKKGPPFFKVGGAVRYRRSDLDEYIASQATHQPVHPGVSDDDIRAAVSVVHAFGGNRDGAATELKRWLIEEVGVKLKAARRGEPVIRTGQIVGRKTESAT
ncbi:helix-turn-helix domain-containing protein [Paraburkholderia fungorum]|uniref:helix-turn-helix domain-containing protein n=1 Tax=Paraburkholderia fungorum TaxID=134537 RepID=UPI0038B9751C